MPSLLSQRPSKALPVARSEPDPGTRWEHDKAPTLLAKGTGFAVRSGVPALLRDLQTLQARKELTRISTQNVLKR